MPKMKTKSSVKRRFRTTGSGKLKGNFAYKRHCLGSKSQKMKRKARGSFLLADSDARIVKKFLPYGTPS
ncbi:MAG: 50S ribosomal protein L35 [Rhodospirillaceae bacterium]